MTKGQKTQQEFAQIWENQVIRPKGAFWEIPIKNYLVTVAHWHSEDDGSTILSLLAEDYDETNRHWFITEIKPENLEEAMVDLEILDEFEDTEVFKQWRQYKA